MSVHTADADVTVSQSVSVLTLSARIGESGSITHLPETVRPVDWTAHYAGAEQPWQRVADARTNQEVAPLLAELATAKPPADLGWYSSAEHWRSVEIRFTRKRASAETYERVVGEMRREALAAIDAMGAAFQPIAWEESTGAYLVQGEWTVTVSVSGSDHVAVREAFAAGLPGRRDEIVADAQKRIPRVSRKVSVSDDTPERVRKQWRRDRRRGTVPKPATGRYSPGSWVTWEHPETGQTLTGIVTKWLLGEWVDSTRRTVVPSDGSEPVEMELEPRAKPTAGPWNVVYEPELKSAAQPVAPQP